jgi:hypothetical protein
MEIGGEKINSNRPILFSSADKILFEMKICNPSSG